MKKTNFADRISCLIYERRKTIHYVARGKGGVIRRYDVLTDEVMKIANAWWVLPFRPFQRIAHNRCWSLCWVYFCSSKFRHLVHNTAANQMIEVLRDVQREFRL